MTERQKLAQDLPPASADLTVKRVHNSTVGWPAPVKAASRRRREPKARLERGWPPDHDDRARLAEGAAPGTNSVVYARVNVVVNTGNHAAVMNCISGAHERPSTAPAPRSHRPSAVYGNADYQTGEPDDPQYKAEWGASHLALFVAWAVNHDLLSAKLRKPAAAVKARRARPLEWLFAHRDGRLAEADLTEAGTRFARYYYGTPAEGLRAGEGSYLQDFIATLKGGDDTALVEDSRENYDDLAPIIDQRHAAFIRRPQSGVKHYGIAHDSRITRTPSSNLPA